MAKECPILKKIYAYREDRSKYPSRILKDNGANKQKINGTFNEVINKKKTHFSRTGTKAERTQNKTEGLVIMFTNQELKSKIERNPYCYLTGDKLDLSDSQTWSLDHVIPRSKGGDNSLDNCGLATKTANQMKGDQTYVEFVQNCVKVIMNYKNSTDKQNDELNILINTLLR